MVFSWKITGFV